MQEYLRQGPARLDPHGPAADDDDLGQAAFPIAPSKYKFAQHGQVAACGSANCCRTRPRWSTTCASSAACTPRRSTTSRPSRYMQTGNQVTGRPCLGAWASYGLGSLNDNLPTFVVLVAKPTQHRAGAGDLRPALVSRAICPASTPASRSAPAAIRSCTSTIRPACRREVRRKTLDGLKALNEMNYQQVGDPETHTRIQQYELAFRMQASVPELTDLAQRARVDLRALRRRRQEARHVRQHRPAGPPAWSSAACASCRSITTTGTRTPTSPAGCPINAGTSIKPCYGLIQDLKQRGTARRDARHLGRRVRPHDLLAGRPVARRTTAAIITRAASRCGWPAAARRAARSTARPTTSPTTSSRIPVHIRDFHATVLHLLGFDHERFTYRYQGLDQKLTGVEPARVVKELIG